MGTMQAEQSVIGVPTTRPVSAPLNPLLEMPGVVDRRNRNASVIPAARMAKIIPAATSPRYVSENVHQPDKNDSFGLLSRQNPWKHLAVSAVAATMSSSTRSSLGTRLKTRKSASMAAKMASPSIRFLLNAGARPRGARKAPFLRAVTAPSRLLKNSSELLERDQSLRTTKRGLGLDRRPPAAAIRRRPARESRSGRISPRLPSPPRRACYRAW